MSQPYTFPALIYFVLIYILYSIWELCILAKYPTSSVFVIALTPPSVPCVYNARTIPKELTDKIQAVINWFIVSENVTNCGNHIHYAVKCPFQHKDPTSAVPVDSPLLCVHPPASRWFVFRLRENHFAVCHPTWSYFRARVIRLVL